MLVVSKICFQNKDMNKRVNQSPTQKPRFEAKYDSVSFGYATSVLRDVRAKAISKAVGCDVTSVSNTQFVSTIKKPIHEIIELEKKLKANILKDLGNLKNIADYNKAMAEAQRISLLIADSTDSGFDFKLKPYLNGKILTDSETRQIAQTEFVVQILRQERPLCSADRIKMDFCRFSDAVKKVIQNYDSNELPQFTVGGNIFKVFKDSVKVGDMDTGLVFIHAS